MSRLGGLSAAILLLGLPLTGCSRTVNMSDPSPAPADQGTCEAVMAALPDTVLKQPRRTVHPGKFAAAWGNPTITVKCGVTAPAGLTATSECSEVNGVGWYAEQAKGGYYFTTIGRPVYVQVAVPSKYAPEAGALVDVAEAVKKIPVKQPCF